MGVRAAAMAPQEACLDSREVKKEEEEKEKQPVHVTVVVDTTGSMGSYCTATGGTLQQLFIMLDVLFEGGAGVDVVAYEDYCDGPRLLRTSAGSRAELQAFAATLRAGGGGDTPEAAKTALNSVVEGLRARNGDSAGASSRTLVIHYTDAPPHFGADGSSSSNNSKERQALAGKEPGFDWLHICRAFRELGTQVVTFMPPSMGSDARWFWALLGECVALPATDPCTITKYTMGVLLRLMGQPFEGITCARFVEEPDLSSLQDERERFSKELKAAPVELQPHPAFRRDLRQLIQHFKDDEQFEALVFEALKELFVPEKVLAITYNSVLGMLWRLVCKRREDPRLAPLCDALSTCCQSLTGTMQAQLRTWVDESYNQLDEIRDLIRAVPQPLEEGVIVLDVQAENMPTKEEMRSLMHAPSPGVLRKVQSLLTRLLIVKRGELPVDAEDDAPMYLPLALKDKDLFSTLSHLLLPGMMLSLRPAAMMAILAHLSGNMVLQPRAQRFLEAWKGQWIPAIDKAEDYPEILNAEFVKLVVRVPEYLTESEGTLYKHLHHITRVRRAATLRLSVRVGYTPRSTELIPDRKLACRSCGHTRSFTLMKDGICGLCMYDDEHGKCSSEPAEDRSHMVECRTCQALYAVVRTGDLNVAPKCHFCRNRETAPVVHCTACGNKFCAPTASDRVEDHVCASCALDVEGGTPAKDVPLRELIDSNPQLLCRLGLPEASRDLVFDRLGLFKLWTRHSEELALVEAAPLEALIWAGKPVRNAANVQEDMLQKVHLGRLSETCNLCFEERALPALQSSCGHCQNLACSDCLRSWYGRLAPGRLYVPSEGLCAFCKRTPKAATLRSFNRLATRLAGRRTLELEAGLYYAWCRTCFRIAEAAPRECAREPPALEHFECQACKERHASERAMDEEALKHMTRKCPSCAAPTVKISGCNHITCAHCDAHWCWQCGLACAEEEIYDHMQEAHGSIGLDDDLDFDSD